MAKSKIIKGYFFKAQKQSQSLYELMSPNELLGLLDHIGNLNLQDKKYVTDSEERTIILPQDKNRVAGIEIPNYPGYVSGMLLAKRDVNLPMTGIDNGETLNLRPIDLGGGNLMEVTYFMVHKKTGILLFLNNRAAGTHVSLAQNLSSFLGNTTKQGFKVMSGNAYTDYIFLAHILNMNSLERVEDLLAVKSMEFRFVGDPMQIRKNLAPGQTNQDISNIMGIADYFDAFNIAITLKPIRGKQLSRNRIPGFFNWVEPIMRMNDKSRFTVSGKGQGSGLEMIDLLNDRFLFTTTIRYEGEFVPAVDVFNAMQVNFEERLTAMIASPIE
jgi:hypothetical protein